MKTGFLLLYCLSFLSIYIYFFSHRKATIKSYNDMIDPFFSQKNPRVVTVSKEPEYRERKAKTDENPLPNTKFIYKPKEFEIDDTESIRSTGLACEPKDFGYTVERGKQVFPYHGYPKCSEVSDQNDTYIHIDRKSNKIYMDCPENENDKYIIGPFDDKKIITRKEGHSNWKVLNYEHEISAKGVEFALGSCGKDNGDMIQSYMTPIFNRSAYEKAIKLVKGKPKIIYFLTLDSMSRRHFFRKTPKLVKFLNKLNQNSNFSVFDFKLHNNHGDTSPRNQVPIFSGTSTFPMYNIKNKDQDLLGSKALWNMLRSKGYINLVAFEDCDGSFVGYFGKYPNIEYSVGPFYCAVEKYTSNSFRKNKAEQRCLGGHMSHYYVLNYTDEVVDLNPGANLMLYVHLSAAHEYTGNHAETLDEDIRDHLSSFLQKYSSDYDILIFLQADHGMKYGDFFRDIPAYQENKLPGLFIIGSKSLLDQYPYSYHSLDTNTRRLVSKIDYRRTVLEMEGLEDSNKASINLLSQISPKSRICDDLGISPMDCSCLTMTKLNSTSSRLDTFLDALKDYAQNLINSESYSSLKYPIGKICKKVELGKIRKIYQTAVSNVIEMIKIEVGSDTKSGLVFEITFIIANDRKYVKSSKYKFNSWTFAFLRYPVKARILSINRLDSYAGPCEIKANKKGLRPDWCICQD